VANILTTSIVIFLYVFNAGRTYAKYENFIISNKKEIKELQNIIKMNIAKNKELQIYEQNKVIQCCKTFK
jgi:hypothetical protein